MHMSLVVPDSCCAQICLAVVQGEGIAYGTKEGRLRMLQHELLPPGRSGQAPNETPRPEDTSVQQLSRDVFAEDDR